MEFQISLLHQPKTIDLKRLKGDIPKFFSSRCFEESHKSWWAKFLDAKYTIFKNPEKSQTWMSVDIVSDQATSTPGST